MKSVHYSKNVYLPWRCTSDTQSKMASNSVNYPFNSCLIDGLSMTTELWQIVSEHLFPLRYNIFHN